MEWSSEFARYLPHSPASQDEAKYNRQLIERIAVNYEAGQYDFAALACHLTTLRITQYKLWQSKKANPSGFRTAASKIENIRNPENFGEYPANFSQTGERDIIRLSRTLGIPEHAICDQLSLLEKRNLIAHPSGKVIYDAIEEANERLTIGLSVVETMQRYSKVAVAKIYREFIKGTVQTPEYDPAETETAIQEELIRNHYLSPQDIEVCKEQRMHEILRGEDLRRAGEIQNVLKEHYE